MCFRCTKADEARGERGKHLRVQVRVCGVVCVRARACVVRLRMGREQCVVGVRALACVSVGESGVGAVHVALVAAVHLVIVAAVHLVIAAGRASPRRVKLRFDIDILPCRQYVFARRHTQRRIKSTDGSSEME